MIDQLKDGEEALIKVLENILHTTKERINNYDKSDRIG
jgi:hypothetical protein